MDLAGSEQQLGDDNRLDVVRADQKFCCFHRPCGRRAKDLRVLADPVPFPCPCSKQSSAVGEWTLRVHFVLGGRRMPQKEQAPRSLLFHLSTFLLGVDLADSPG